jgi:beta-glucanase (GH16 family)
VLWAGSRRGTRRLWTAVAAAAVLVGAGVTAVVWSTSGADLVWSDEFDGADGSAPNPTNWTQVTGGDGWGNNELECYTSERKNSALDGDGHLVITANRHDGYRCADGSYNDYTSARLTTKDLHQFSYGRLEMRAEVPTASATWPAFWALGSNHDEAGWPQSGEIDVMEAVGSDPGVVHGTLHGASNAAARLGRADWQLGGKTGFTAGWHVFAAEWSRDAISFSVDDRVYATVERADAEAVGAWPFDQPFYLLLNLAVGGNFGGAPDATATWPQRYVVDYVRVYSEQ